MKVYRICKTKRSRDLSGEGARIAGGRWNSKGARLLYCSEHVSLAALEVMVHIDSIVMQMPHACMEIFVPDDPQLYLQIHARDLPADWQSYPAPTALRSIGDDFIQENQYLGLRVPSAVSPREFNLFVNPAHPRFGDVKIIQVYEQFFDPRIKNQNLQ